MTRRLLHFVEESYGGAADYAHAQSNALADLGIEVHLLTTPNYPLRPDARYHRRPELLELRPAQPLPTRAQRATRFAYVKLTNYRRLAACIRREGFQQVLIGSFGEYLAPVWSPWLCKLAREGVVFGAVVHDPVRDYIVGPRWWHRWSVAAAYAPLREVFVHEATTLDTGGQAFVARVTVVPHGVYDYPAPARSRSETRRALGIPESATLFLAFGNIRDGKNLDLFLRALAQTRDDFPDAHLLVAGDVRSAGQKPVAYYQTLAAELGLAARCRWRIGDIAPEETAELLTAADVMVLTYARAFRSASGVLALAAHYRVPCLAAGGDGPLRRAVADYGLGVWCAPNDVNALVAGLKRWRATPPTPRWEDYRADHSWAVNAQRVAERLFELQAERFAE
ncbi:MAG: glycosyltransferase family 4 protein [Chloracidobacterium sp.]|nr:glycosyltransferase family 4 protein [Chloracidobacterium sp.]MDW8217979.1 glycosyltransferase family 4 protein [Acidobacteriota bacterium]